MKLFTLKYFLLDISLNIVKQENYLKRLLMMK